mgnify:CR=1 FL=1
MDYKWCTYSYINKQIPQYIGKAFDIKNGSCKIIYHDGQLYPPEFWNCKYVMFFESLEECLYYIYTNSNISLHEIEEMTRDRFNESVSNNTWDVIHRKIKIEKIKKMMTK